MLDVINGCTGALYGSRAAAAGSFAPSLLKRINAYTMTMMEFPRTNACSGCTNITKRWYRHAVWAGISAFGGRKFIFHVFSCLNRGITTIKFDTTPDCWLVTQDYFVFILSLLYLNYDQLFCQTRVRIVFEQILFVFKWYKGKNNRYNDHTTVLHRYRS